MTTAVLDIGKTNIKLLLVEPDGGTIEIGQRPNALLPGPPWRHPDLAGIEAWLLEGLREVARDHRLDAFIASGHGSGGVLVDETGPVLPSIDYENEPPAELLADYARIVPDFPERGAPLLGGASHLARQLLWIERTQPGALDRARWFMALPWYFAWRLSGVAAGEATMLGAQSHLWSPLRADFTTLADRAGWRRLLPPVLPGWQVLGPPRAELALPSTMRVLPGVHDSTANLYRYQRAGLDDFVLLSTGTWIVGMSTATPLDRVDEARGMGLTCDVWRRPVAGVLAMTGREYAAITGGTSGRADLGIVGDLVRRGTMALPGWVGLDGIYPGSGGRGRILGPEPASVGERQALATLYAALVAEDCADLLVAHSTVVIDGGFTVDPAFAGLLAALRPDLRVLVEPEGRGTAGGAALLVSHEQEEAVNLRLELAPALAIEGLAAYRERWRRAVADHLAGDLP
jgi:sugar (pentulose or hexulose) kinase